MAIELRPEQYCGMAGHQLEVLTRTRRHFQTGEVIHFEWSCKCGQFYGIERPGEPIQKRPAPSQWDI